MLKFIAALIKHCTIPAVVECHHVVMCTWWCITNTPPPPLRWAAVHLVLARAWLRQQTAWL